jgi:hypothetical protein
VPWVLVAAPQPMTVARTIRHRISRHSHLLLLARLAVASGLLTTSLSASIELFRKQRVTFHPTMLTDKRVLSVTLGTPVTCLVLLLE